VGSESTKPIHVYGPPRTEDLVKAALQYFTIIAEIRTTDGGRTVPIARVYFGHDFGTGVIYEDANVKVTAVENSHFCFHNGGPSAGKHKSYSYRFETSDCVIVIIGDTGPNEAVTELANGADLLVAEANSVDDRKQNMIDSGAWQAMTPVEQARIMRQATGGAFDPDRHRKNGHTRQRQDCGADAPDDAGRHGRLHAVGRGGEEALFRPGGRR